MPDEIAVPDNLLPRPVRPYVTVALCAVTACCAWALTDRRVVWLPKLSDFNWELHWQSIAAVSLALAVMLTAIAEVLDLHAWANAVEIWGPLAFEAAKAKHSERASWAPNDTFERFGAAMAARINRRWVPYWLIAAVLLPAMLAWAILGQPVQHAESYESVAFLATYLVMVIAIGTVCWGRWFVRRTLANWAVTARSHAEREERGREPTFPPLSDLDKPVRPTRNPIRDIRMTGEMFAGEAEPGSPFGDPLPAQTPLGNDPRRTRILDDDFDEDPGSGFRMPQPIDPFDDPFGSDDRQGG